MHAHGVFSDELALQLHSFNPQYVLGSLLFCITAARFPEFTKQQRRLQSFQQIAPSQVDEASRIQWSDAGFFMNKAGVAVCFHCGGRSALPPGSMDPLRVHERCSEACELLRLLRVAHGTLSEQSEQVMTSARKLRQALIKLQFDLQQHSSMLNLIESFGFTRSSIVFCACRLFMTRGGYLANKPSDVMEEIHKLEQQLPDLGQVIDVEHVLSECTGLADQRPAVQETRVPPAAQQQQQRQEQQRQEQSVGAAADREQHEMSPAMAQPSCGPGAGTQPRRGGLSSQVSREESESMPSCADLPPSDSSENEKCVQCKVRNREHVSLPCAHLLLCHSCLGNTCPKCGAQILATIRAFIA